MLASFEKTTGGCSLTRLRSYCVCAEHLWPRTDHLFEGAFYGKRDSIHGVSECIIMCVSGLRRSVLRMTDSLFFLCRGNPANAIGTAL